MQHTADRDRAINTLSDLGRIDLDELLSGLGTTRNGLAAAQAEERLRRNGPNRITEEDRYSLLREIWKRFRTPLNGLLLGLALTSWFLSDVRSAAVILVMVTLSVGLGFVQEHRSNLAAARLKQMVQVHATVRRSGAAGADPEGWVSLPLEQVVVGDVVRLAAGDIVPADIR